jgi:hypothetical protein
MVYKRKRVEEQAEESDDGLDSDEREALAAFNDEGFDEGLEESEQKRKEVNEIEAEARLAEDRRQEQELRDREDRKAAEARKKEVLQLIEKEKEAAARANSPNRRVVFVGGLAAAGVTQVGLPPLTAETHTYHHVGGFHDARCAGSSG